MTLLISSSIPHFPISKTDFLMTNFQSIHPNHSWKIGSGARDEEWKKHAKVAIDPKERTKAENYFLLSSAIVPRPIGFVSTIKENGVKNLAPFSYFNVVCTDPPLFVLTFSSGRKDTLDAILHSKEMTINIISDWFVEAAHFTSIDAPADTDEFEMTGLTPVDSEMVKPPHVAESAFSVEAVLVDCKRYESKTNPGSISSTVLTVEGVNMHAREDMLNSQKTNIDIEKFKPIGRLGGNTYVKTDMSYNFPKPVYEKLENGEYN